MKRILLITPTFAPDVGGVETMLKNFCAYLTKHKYLVDVITYSPLIVRAKAPRKEALNEFVTVRRIPWIGWGLFNIFEKFPPIQFLYLVPGLLLGTILFLLRRTRRPDIIHVFGLSGAFVGGLVSRIFGIPSVIDMCTVYRFAKRPLLTKPVRILLDWSDYIRGNNPAGKEELLNIGLAAEKVGMITPPVDEAVFQPIPQVEARAKVGLPEKRYVALFVGRMVDSKNLDIAVNASKLIKMPEVEFVFIGDGPLRYLVEEAAVIDKRIRIIGEVKHHDLRYYYNSADILICAPVDSDLIAFVGREALMCGLPILAPNVAVYFGIPRRVNPELLPSKVGRLLEPTAEALAELLEELIRIKATRKTSPFDRRDCRKYALDHYSTCAMQWLGDAYRKASRIRFSKKK